MSSKCSKCGQLSTHLLQSYSPERYAKLLEQVQKRIDSLSALKGGEYAGDADRLANFRRNAERLGLRMEQVWAVCANEHIDAINQFIKDLASGKQRQRAEPLQGRVDDVIVYMILFKAMLDEQQAGERLEL